MKLHMLNTNIENIFDIELTHNQWFKQGTFLVQSFRVIDNYLVSVSGSDSKSPILGMEKMDYSRISKTTLWKINNLLKEWYEHKH